MEGRKHLVRILLADDDHRFADSQAGWLRDEGYNVSCVYSEEEARGYLAAHDRELDIALLDMYMETEESGLRLVELISRQYPWIVSIIVTAYGDLKNAARCMEAGAFSYLPKGESPPELILQTIDRAADRVSLRDKLRVIVPALRQVGPAMLEVLKRIHDVEELVVRIEGELREVPPQDGHGSGDTSGERTGA